MVRDIGDIFEYNDTKLKVVIGEDCDGCYFEDKSKIGCFGVGDCDDLSRKDRASVIFQEVKEGNMSDNKFVPQRKVIGFVIDGESNVYNLYYISKTQIIYGKLGCPELSFRKLEGTTFRELGFDFAETADDARAIIDKRQDIRSQRPCLDTIKDHSTDAGFKAVKHIYKELDAVWERLDREKEEN